MSDREITGPYRLYWINDAGKVDAVTDCIEAANDIDAVIKAVALAEGDRVELWNQVSLVAKLAPSSPSTTLN